MLEDLVLGDILLHVVDLLKVTEKIEMLYNPPQKTVFFPS